MKFGNIGFTNIKFGDKQISKRMYGDKLIWEDTTWEWSMDMIITDIQTADVYDFEHTFPNETDGSKVLRGIATDADHQPFQAKYDFMNISNATEADILITDCPIANGDNLVIVKNDESIHEVVASGVDVVHGDINTLELIESAAPIINPNNPCMSRNGLFYYVPAGAYVTMFNVSTQWSINGLVQIGRFLAYTSNSGAIEAIFFNADGTKMYTAERTNSAGGRIHQFDMPVPYNFPDAIHVATITSASYQPRDISITEDGTTLVQIGEADGKIKQQTMTTPWDITTVTDTKETSGRSAYGRGIEISKDGETLYALNLNYGFQQYRLATPYDITTKTDEIENDITVDGTAGICLVNDEEFLYSAEGGSNTNRRYKKDVKITMPTNSVTAGEIPSKVFAVDAKAKFDIVGNYQDAIKISDNYSFIGDAIPIPITNENVLSTIRTYGDLVDEVGSLIISPKVSLKNIGDKMIELRGSIVKGKV